jgi:hypothetical protein
MSSSSFGSKKVAIAVLKLQNALNNHEIDINLLENLPFSYFGSLMEEELDTKDLQEIVRQAYEHLFEAVNRESFFVFELMGSRPWKYVYGFRGIKSQTESHARRLLLNRRFPATKFLDELLGANPVGRFLRQSPLSGTGRNLSILSYTHRHPVLFQHASHAGYANIIKQSVKFNTVGTWDSPRGVEAEFASGQIINLLATARNINSDESLSQEFDVICDEYIKAPIAFMKEYTPITTGFWGKVRYMGFGLRS